MKLYIIKFKKDSIIKPKVYLPNCIIKGKNQQSIIIIIFDECIFSANDGVQKS